MRVAGKAAGLRPHIFVRLRAEVHVGAAAMQQPDLPAVNDGLVLFSLQDGELLRSKALQAVPSSSPHELPLPSASAAEQKLPES